MAKNQRTYTYLIVIFLLNLSWGRVYAQDNIATAAQMVEIGDEIYNQTLAVMEARELYITAVNMDRNNVRANYMAGITTLQSIDKGAATEYFLKVLELDSEYSFDILYKIGVAYHYDYKFDDAINYYSRYKQKIAGRQPPSKEFATDAEVERKLYECEQGKIMVEFPEEVDIRNIGAGINSANADYAPVINENEDLLIFTSRRQESNLNPDVASDNEPYEDIFVSIKVDSVWIPAENIGQPINTLYHDSNVGLSKDGTSLFIYKDDNGGDIFVSERGADGEWAEPKPMGKPINTPYAETTVSIAPDGRTLFFASDREGGHGGLDIWMTQKNRKEEWDEPVNLGDEINTIYDEDSPFIGYDSKTLYFSSEGGEGMGGFDIYRVTYDSAMQAWGPPENMGYPINTPDHDIYFVPTKDGYNAFYSSARNDGYGNTDVYMLTIPEVLQHQEVKSPVPSPKITLKVKIFNEKNAATDASLRMAEKEGDDRLLASKVATGEYQFVTNPAEPRDYVLTVTAPGYEEQLITISLPAVGETDSEMERSVDLIPLEPVKPPRPVVVSKKLRNVYFNFNRAELRTEYTDKVDAAVAFMKDNPSAKILIIGHSDLIGAEKYNSGLSLRRANTVKQAMVAKGISASRIDTKGEGAKFPLASNDQEKEGRELNRRVEFKVIQ